MLAALLWSAHDIIAYNECGVPNMLEISLVIPQVTYVLYFCARAVPMFSDVAPIPPMTRGPNNLEVRT